MIYYLTHNTEQLTSSSLRIAALATVSPKAPTKAIPPLLVVVAATAPLVIKMGKVARAGAANMQAKAHAKTTLVFILDDDRMLRVSLFCHVPLYTYSKKMSTISSKLMLGYSGNLMVLTKNYYKVEPINLTKNLIKHLYNKTNQTLNQQPNQTPNKQT